MTFLISQNYRDTKKAVVARVLGKEGKDETQEILRMEKLFHMIL